MAIFLKDSNDFEANNLILSRDNFKNEIYPKFIDRFQGMLYDQNFEKPLFGRIDKENNSIFPSEKFLKELNPKINNLLFVHDFVRDAYNELDVYFKKGVATKKLRSPGSPYSGILPVRSFISVHKQYSDYLSKFNLYLIDYVKTSYNKKEIINFKDYVKAFINFINLEKGTIFVTRTKFLGTNLSNSFMSGFSISLSNQQYDDDYSKLEIYVKDNNFPFFLESCRRHSFFVDKNAPWVIHFDFNSEAAQKYLSKYNLSDESDVYEKRFYKAFYTDISILKSFLHHSYTFYSINEPSIDTIVDINDCQSPIIKKQQRELISEKNVSNEYSEFEWLKLYFDIRLVEENITLNKAVYNKAVLDMQNVLKYGVVAGDQNKFQSSQNFINNFIKLNKTQVDYQQLSKY